MSAIAAADPQTEPNLGCEFICRLLSYTLTIAV